MTRPVDGPPFNYRFADLTLDVVRRRVTRQGRTIELKALDFDLLRFLVEQAPNVVNADVLAEKVWGRHFVSPENVAQRVMLLRQSLADDANHPRYIETVRNKGYRLVPAVERALPHHARARHHSLVTAVAAALLAAIGLTIAAAYWLATATEQQAPNPRSVAVLPFENLSSNPDDAYFAVGMQDQIVNQLTKISGLRVFPVPPNGAQRSVLDLGRELNVATVLRGSVQYARGRVQVSTHLSDTENSQNLWADSYEGDLSDIFRLQSEIALELAQALRVELSPEERERVERVPTTVARARDLYLLARGRDPLSAEVLLATDEVEQAVALDPEFIEAWAYDSHFRNYAQIIDPARIAEHRRQSEQAARRALELDPEFAPAHSALGWLLATKKDWTGAEAAFRRAVDLNSPSGSMGSYAWLQLDAGKFDTRARDIFDDARAADPQNPLYYRSLAFVHEGLGESTRANDLYTSALSLLSSDSLERRALLTQRMHWMVGHDGLAEAAAIGNPDPLNAAMLASLEDPAPALEQLRREYDATVDGNPNRRRDLGLWAGVFGDPALALEAMRAAIHEQGGLMPYIWLPQLAHMRRLPEFKAFIRDIGMVAYWEEYGWPAMFCRPLGQDDFECD